MSELQTYWDHLHSVPDSDASAIKEKLQLFPNKGNPGAKFASSFQKMLKNLLLPSATREALHISEDVLSKTEETPIAAEDVTCKEVENILKFSEGKPEEEHWLKLFTEGKFNLVPSFFKLLSGLKKAKREYALVFRSFGSELPDVVFELN